MILTAILEKNAIESPGKTALCMRMGYRTVSLTYKDVYELSKKTAILLQKKGLKKGDKVLLLAPNSPYWIVVFWGTLLAGGVIVPLNIQSTPEMIKKIADQTEAKIIFRYDIEFLKECLEPIDTSTFCKAEILENETAQILYTSGTTGDPKGAVLTHKNISSNMEALGSVAGISERDRFLSILPLSHVFEQVAGFLVPYHCQATIVYAHSPAAIRDLLKEYQITVMAAVPEFLRLLLSKIESRAAEKGKKKLFDALLHFSSQIGSPAAGHMLFRSLHKNLGGCLRTIASGGAVLDPSLEKKWNALGLVILQGYGLTETSPVLTTNTFRDRRPGSVGKALPGVQIKIAPDGEVLAKGPNVFGGYFKNEARTKEVFTDDGWFCTGDIGELDKDGFLFLKGRKKYVILGPGGQNVYPEDIETELNKLPGIKDSCVVGLEKEGGWVEIHAVLLLDPVGAGFMPAQPLIEEANKNLASYQKITACSVWPEEDFPRSATRKVAKEKVIDWLNASRVGAGFIAAPPGAGMKPAPTPIIHLLSEITNTPASRIGRDTKIIEELGLDSLQRIELVTALEEKFGALIDETSIHLSTRVSDLEEAIQKKEPPKGKLTFKNWPLSPPARWARGFLQTILLFPIFGAYIRLNTEGKENLKGLKFPVIFMPNHLSFLDSVALLMAIPRPIRKRLIFAVAQDVLYVSFRKWAAAVELVFNTFPFPRREEENIKYGLETMGRLLDKNWSVIVYPEGRISITGELQPLKRGAGLIAVEMDTPIVPVKLSGTHDILPLGKYFPQKRGPVRIAFGKPIYFKRSDSYIEVTEKIQEALQRL